MKKHLATQFDPAGSMRGRPLERALLMNRTFNAFMHCVGMFGFTMMVWPRFVAPYRWHLTRHEMVIPELPGALEGFRILHLTDLHLGTTRTDYVERVIDACMVEKPDLIALTGDLISYHRRGLHALPGILKRLSAPEGVVAIFGNHDYHEESWRHVGRRSARRAIHKRMVRALAENNVRLLRNEVYVVRRGGAELKIVGLDELWAGNHNPGAAFEGVLESDACICLQHNPDGCAALKDYPWRWMLCGHSHGGQIDLPIVGPIYVPQEHREWLRGRFEFADKRGGIKTMFVSCGVGHTTPVRMRVRPEATVFTLRGAKMEPQKIHTDEHR